MPSSAINCTKSVRNEVTSCKRKREGEKNYIECKSVKTGGAQCVLNVCIPSMLRELSGSFYSRYSAMVEKEKKRIGRERGKKRKEKFQ